MLYVRTSITALTIATLIMIGCKKDQTTTGQAQKFVRDVKAKPGSATDEVISWYKNLVSSANVLYEAESSGVFKE